MSNKILIYGEGWTGTLPQLLHSDLKGKGIESKVFDFTDIMPGIRNRHFSAKVMRRIFFRLYEIRINYLFLKLIRHYQPSTIVVVKGLNLKLETLARIKEAGIMLINWNPDDFFNMRNSNNNLIEAIKYYDLIISPRPHLFKKYYSYGAKKLLFLDWYYVPNLHYFQNLEKTIDYSFVGSWSEYREGFIDSIGKTFCIRGGGWEKSSNKFKKKHDVDPIILSQHDMCTLFNKTKINLNMLTPENEDLTNVRFFEVTGCGGLLLTERNSHSGKILKDKSECLMYSSSEDVTTILGGDFNIEEISKSGHQRIINGKNSFSDRVDTLLGFLKDA